MKGLTNSTHFLYMYGDVGIFYADASRITGVGHCIVYFHSGLSTTLYSINGNHLHTFCFYTTNRTGDATVKTFMIMTQDAFNEIVERFRIQHPAFVSNAEWDLLEGDDSDSVKIKVRLMVNLELNGEVNKIPVSGTVQTQNAQKPIEGAILAINDKLLAKLQTI